MVKLTPEACRAARGLLKWGVRELGAESGVSFETITQFENGRPMRDSTAAKILAAFASANIEISNGDAPGARLLKNKPKAKAAAVKKTKRKA